MSDKLVIPKDLEERYELLCSCRAILQVSGKALLQLHAAQVLVG
jgi:hypothetical protein